MFSPNLENLERISKKVLFLEIQKIEKVESNTYSYCRFLSASKLTMPATSIAITMTIPMPKIYDCADTTLTVRDSPFFKVGNKRY
jgi:hypothetical protein